MVRHFGPIRRSEIGRSQLEWRALLGKREERVAKSEPDRGTPGVPAGEVWTFS